MLEELEKAQKYIFMEYFIVEEGYMWGRILDVLTRKERCGEVPCAADVVKEDRIYGTV